MMLCRAVARRSIFASGSLGSLARSSLILAVSLALVGCGGGAPPAPDLGKPLAVKGKVTMDGAPAANVEVTFTRAAAGQAAPESRQFVAKTDANGEFSMPKVFPADYSVMVADPAEVKQPDAAVETGKYKNYGVNSTLSAKVAEGSTDFPFELTSK